MSEDYFPVYSFVNLCIGGGGGGGGIERPILDLKSRDGGISIVLYIV